MRTKLAVLLVAVLSCWQVSAVTFLKNESTEDIYVEVYDQYSTSLGQWYVAGSTWTSLGAVPEGAYIYGYSAITLDSVFVEDVPDFYESWQLSYFSAFDVSWTDLGPGVVLGGYSQNIVGKLATTLPSGSSYISSPFGGFYGDTAISAVEANLPNSTVLDGTYTWVGSWLNNLVPMVTAGEPIAASAPSASALYWRGDVVPGPGQTVNIVIPESGMFASALPYNNEQGAFPAVSGLYVYDPITDYEFSYVDGYGWYDYVLQVYTNDLTFTAGRAYYCSTPGGDVLWQQSSSEIYPRWGDTYLTLSASGFLSATPVCANYQVVFYKPKITTPQWAYNTCIAPSTSGVSVTGEGFFQVVDAGADNDADGLPDWWELDQRTDPAIADGAADPDRNGVNNYDEFVNRASARASSLKLSVYTVSQDSNSYHP